MTSIIIPAGSPCEVQSFGIEGTSIRGRLVRLGKTYEEILKNHNYPNQVAGLLGELTVMTISLADSLKYEGQFILQTQSDGPINMMVSNVTSSGEVRSYAKYKIKDVSNTNKQKSIPYLLGKGHIAFTVDQGINTERYQGIAALEGSSLAECAQNYFRKSEQIETAILLAASPNQKKAAGIMIQKMPISTQISNSAGSLLHEKGDDDWRNSVILMGSLTTDEILDTNVTTHEILYRLYHEAGVRIHNAKSLKFQCQCSNEKIGTTLAAFPRKEIDSMKTIEGLITANCEFCGTQFTFDDELLRNLRKKN